MSFVHAFRKERNEKEKTNLYIQPGTYEQGVRYQGNILRVKITSVRFGKRDCK